MERLTNRNYGEISRTGRIVPYSTYCIGCISEDCDCGIVEDMIKKLADYEDLEEQDKLVKLPCKVGDIVYVDSETIPTKNMEFEEVKEIPLFFEAKVVSFRQNGNGNYFKLKVKAKWLHEWVDPDCGPDCAYFEVEKYFTYPLSSIGKTVFLTKSEAEAKLEELRGEE
jgi:hypothetical protein